MQKSIVVPVIALTFMLGTALGSFAAKKRGVSSAAWAGSSSNEAAARLLDLAGDFAEDGSWQNINLGRAHYLSGSQEQAEILFDRYRNGDDAGDLIRIARVYVQANEWDKAKPLFDRVLELAPKDEDWLVEIGAYYNLNGDREHAEELFERGFKSAPRNLNNTLTAAGSYLGVTPRKR